MSNRRNDIEETEIRIISKHGQERGGEKEPSKKSAGKIVLAVIAAACVLVALYGVIFLLPKIEELELRSTAPETEIQTETNEKQKPVEAEAGNATSEAQAKGFTTMRDTTVNNIGLTILTPENARAELRIGGEAAKDSSAVLVVEAADIRADNGDIVGTYVDRGALVSKGQSKAGFCAIIDGAMTVGVADATPYLEQAIESEGYFFRQYPLVVAGQVVENKPKGKSLRKALAELNGRHVVILSRGETSFHDFSQALADLGVSNAIYLVGSKAYGFAKDETGGKTEFGLRSTSPAQNVNYLVWR
ncbi:MAG: phosphodiester glycosidase family protein [Muribaculaceae bacterium]|nr:phosphodiester glycosidase family protein [Muribaculaceae bacterium]